MKNFKLLLILLLLCLILTACNNKGSGISASEPVTTVPASTVPANSSAVNDCVAAARVETFTCTDKNKNTVKTTYRIPALKFDTPDALEINGDIQKRYSDAFSEAKEAAGNNKTPAYDSIDYEAYVNDDIVSIKITAENAGHNLSYSVYNYNKTTGKRLDNEKLLSYLQRDSESTYSDLKQALEDDYTSKFKYENFPDDYYYQMELTVGDEAVRQSQLFLNKEAELYAVCTERASVGSGEFQVLISLA